MGYFRNRNHRRLRKRDRFGKKHSCSRKAIPSELLNLTQVSAGGRAQVLGYSHHLSSERLAQLQAYGLVPGAWVMVVQHSPVTIIRVDHTELAMEEGMACKVQVADWSETNQ
jgi:Fe2+ transport system protein FeoA